MSVKINLLLLSFLLLLASQASAQPPNPELPLIRESDQIVRHYAYALSYKEAHEQAEWVAYMLCRERAVSSQERTDKFLEDKLVKTGSATTKDYAKSGYDRGHLAPAADMGWSAQTMKESFYFSNMSPQLPAFNRGIWKRMEEQVRQWALAYDTIYVVTGPVLKIGLPTIGPNKVSVPEYYYKAILDYTPKPRCIAFLIQNKGDSNALQHFTVAVDRIEELTGLDFFAWLPDAVEIKLEKECKPDLWSW